MNKIYFHLQTKYRHPSLNFKRKLFVTISDDQINDSIKLLLKIGRLLFYKIYVKDLQNTSPLQPLIIRDISETIGWECVEIN